ncbi:MAG: restriction endonuclease subunit S [Mesorhizobium sp.]|nr:MAG: restriction endonuclease subunit S [Mesorhizobium sp.]
MHKLPKAWSLMALDQLVHADKPIVYGIVQAGPEYPGGTPYIKSSDLGGKIEPEFLSRTSPEIAAQYSRSIVRPGDIVFSLRGNIGELSIVPGPLHEANLTQGTARISVNGRAFNEFVAHTLKSPFLQKRIATVGKGSTFKEISLEELRKLEVPIPPLPEQVKIAEILRSWDEAIDKTHLLRVAKERRYKALARKLFDPCHPTFQSRPNGWREWELGDVFRERIQSGEENDRLLSITMSGGVIDRESVGRKDTSTDDKSNYKLILPGDIGYNTMRMWQGVAGLSNLRGIISPAYTVVTPIQSRILGRYAAHLFKSRRMVFDFERYSQGLTSDTWNLKFPAFSKIKVFLPRVEDQERQANLLDALSVEISVIGRYVETLTRQKRGLMQKLLSGEWRVQRDEAVA